MQINGKMLKDAFISAALTLGDMKKVIDDMNVYPVPDGDTGTNMSLTLHNALEELKKVPDNASAAEVASKASAAMIRGARGNSGVITSLLFRGFSKALPEGTEELNCDMVADAFEHGVKNAYKAVMKPVEGTILTVSRVASETAREMVFNTNDVLIQWTEMVTAAKEALAKTPDQLPILKKAGVVDAGAQGFVVIIEEMLRAFKGEPRAIPEDTASVPKNRYHIEFKEDEEIVYAYCTEYIVNGEHTPEQAADLRSYLESIGNCAVVLDDEDIIKIHVHTNNPGLAFEKGLKIGYLSNMKIDNMRLQRQKRLLAEKEKEVPVPAEPEKTFGFVTVANGSGVIDMFKDLGADEVVMGGQTMNPSAEDILRAVYSVPAQTVFVLPNNKNIVMAAEQAMKISEKNMYVLPTTSIPQGMSAMMAFDPDADIDVNRNAMSQAAEKVGSGLITFAARNSSFSGHDIKSGDIMALENGRLIFVDRDITRAAYKLTRKLVKGQKGSTVYVTILVGSDIPDDKAHELELIIKSKMGNVDLNIIRGDQPVYYYIISAEGSN